MFKDIANKAMTTSGQKAGAVINHLITALGREPSSTVRRALILVKIDETPGTSQKELSQCLDIDKVTLSREVDWLFNYGCIVRAADPADNRVMRLSTCGYAKASLSKAVSFFEAGHDGLKFLLRGLPLFLKQDNPPLREAQIYMAVFEKGTAEKIDIKIALQNSPASTTNKALKKMLDLGIIEDDGI